MKRILSLVLALSLAATGAYAQQLVASAAKVDVTPSESDLLRPIDSIRGTLNVRALYVSDGTTPAAKTMVVTIADGTFESGYIYSDKAANHLTFQVIGSRIKPGYAEEGIVESALRLIQKVK